MRVWNAIVRMFTLPKNRNSLSDILGVETATVVQSTMKKLIAEAARAALVSLDSNIAQGASAVQNKVASGVTSKLSGVSPVIATQVNSVVAQAIGSASEAALRDIERVVSEIADGVAKALGLE